jgi:hypothetical protein
MKILFFIATILYLTSFMPNESAAFIAVVTIGSFLSYAIIYFLRTFSAKLIKDNL